MKKLSSIFVLFAGCGVASAQITPVLGHVGVGHGIGRPRDTTDQASLVYQSTTIAGTGLTAGYNGDSGPANMAQLANPVAITLDSKGNYYISDYENHVVREVFAATGNIATIAGNGTPGYGGDGGPATSAEFYGITSLAVDGSGNLYLADPASGRVRVVNSAGVINTFAGNGMYGDAGDHGPAVNATLYYPSGVAVDAAGDVYIADYGNATVRMVAAGTGIITTVAGIDYSGFGQFPGEGGPAVQATLGNPYAVAVDESGNLYIDDIGTGSIQKVDKNGYINTFLADVSTDSITTDAAGNLYYADYDNNVVNKVLPDGTIIAIGGVRGVAGYAGDFGPGVEAQYNWPYSVAVDSSSNVYVADYNNDVIRLLTPVHQPTALVIDGANEVTQTLTPGEVVSIFGTNIGNPTQVAAQPNANGVFATQFASTTVTFNGIPAPILISGPTYISAVVPYELYGSGATQANVVVTYAGQTTGVATVAYSDAPDPEIFTGLSTGVLNGFPVLNADGTVNSPSNAAAASSNITLYVTGEGQTSPAGVDGLVTGTSNMPTPLSAVSVTFAGTAATIVSATEAPGQVAGVLQIVATLPSSVSGSVAVQVTVGAASSNLIYIDVQ